MSQLRGRRNENGDWEWEGATTSVLAPVYTAPLIVGAILAMAMLAYVFASQGWSFRAVAPNSCVTASEASAQGEICIPTCLSFEGVDVQSECTPCPEGATAHTDGEECTPCPEVVSAQTDSEECTPCPEGVSAENDSEECTPCPDGASAQTDSEECTRTPTPPPTGTPTTPPTDTPSATPSPTPTIPPTDTPTPSPEPTVGDPATQTPAPTPSPTNSPTPSPTDSPSATPTTPPTHTPSPTPTTPPTHTPSPTPTTPPTDTPSPTPTDTPTATPSKTPSPTLIGPETSTPFPTPKADISLVKTDSPDPAVRGGALIYSITVSNVGSADAENVVVTDTFPADVTWISATPTQGSCTLNVCALGTIAASQAAGIAVVVTVNADARATFTNRACAATSTFDKNPDNNCDDEETRLQTPLGATSTPNGMPQTGGLPGDGSADDRLLLGLGIGLLAAGTFAAAVARKRRQSTMEM